VRKTPIWPRSWAKTANCSPFQLHCKVFAQ
jgi:hypothetical protein